MKASWHIFHFRQYKNELIRVSGEDKRLVNDKMYVSSEQLFSFGYAWVIPKASPFKASNLLAVTR